MKRRNEKYGTRCSDDDDRDNDDDGSDDDDDDDDEQVAPPVRARVSFSASCCVCVVFMVRPLGS